MLNNLLDLNLRPALASGTTTVCLADDKRNLPKRGQLLIGITRLTGLGHHRAHAGLFRSIIADHCKARNHLVVHCQSGTSFLIQQDHLRTEDTIGDAIPNNRLRSPFFGQFVVNRKKPETLSETVLKTFSPF